MFIRCFVCVCVLFMSVALIRIFSMIFPSSMVVGFSVTLRKK